MVEGQSRVRRDVLPSLLSVLELNRRHRERVLLFEVGKGYRPEGANERGEPAEVHQLALVWAAPAPGAGVRFDEGAASRLHGVLVDLFEFLELEPPAWIQAAHAVLKLG